MSTFRVKITTGNQGRLDSNAVATGASIQRDIELAGPNRTRRVKLAEGDTFVDSNYYKRYCYPAVPYDLAMLELVSDDGSFYSDFGPEAKFPRVYTKTVTNGTTYTLAANQIDVVGDNGGPSTTTIISVATNDVTVQLNGLSTARYPIAAGGSLTLDSGDLPVTSLAFDNQDSGAATVTVLVNVVAVPNS